MGNFQFFGLNFGKLSNYVQYFGSNNVEGVAESWVEVDGAGWNWVHGLVIPILCYYQRLTRRLNYPEHSTDVHKRMNDTNPPVEQPVIEI